MPSLPTYFFSYARRDDDKAKMLQFFSDLQRTLEEFSRSFCLVPSMRSGRRVIHGRGP